MNHTELKTISTRNCNYNYLKHTWKKGLKGPSSNHKTLELTTKPQRSNLKWTEQSPLLKGGSNLNHKAEMKRVPANLWFPALHFTEAVRLAGVAGIRSYLKKFLTQDLSNLRFQFFTSNKQQKQQDKWLFIILIWFVDSKEPLTMGSL